MPFAFFNDRFVPLNEVAIPFYDAGFVQGVTVAEQMRTFGGKLFRLDEHLARLAQSLKIVEVDPGYSMRELADIARELVARNYPLLKSGDDLGLALFVTPGPYSALAPAEAGGPLVCLHTTPIAAQHFAGKYRQGERLVTSSIRQVGADCWPRELKCRSRMHYFLADREARKIDPHSRALILDADGSVLETTTANITLYRRSEGLITPPREKILPGISVAAMLELAEQIGIPHSERDLFPADVASADEVLMTSTSPCVLPVVSFDGQPIGSGQPGEIFKKLIAAWSQHVGVDIAAQAEQIAKRRREA